MRPNSLAALVIALAVAAFISKIVPHAGALWQLGTRVHASMVHSCFMKELLERFVKGLDVADAICTGVIMLLLLLVLVGRAIFILHGDDPKLTLGVARRVAQAQH